MSEKSVYALPEAESYNVSASVYTVNILTDGSTLSIPVGVSVWQEIRNNIIRIVRINSVFVFAVIYPPVLQFKNRNSNMYNLQYIAPI